MNSRSVSFHTPQYQHTMTLIQAEHFLTRVSVCEGLHSLTSVWQGINKYQIQYWDYSDMDDPALSRGLDWPAS